MTASIHTKISAIIGFSLMIIFTSCQKKEIKGPQGDPGTPGGGGNANISSTSTFVVNSSDWKADVPTESYRVSLPFAALTKDVVDKGTVKVYVQKSGLWLELPYDTGDLFMQYGFQEGILTLYYINIEGGFPAVPTTATYRMVIIS
jgi:hypothetical protein